MRKFSRRSMFSLLGIGALGSAVSISTPPALDRSSIPIFRMTDALRRGEKVRLTIGRLG